MATPRPVTELSNSITENIDSLSPTEMLRCLRQSDSQVWNGFQHFPSILDDPILPRMQSLCDHVKSKLAQNQKVLVIMSGAGTSGRLAHMISRQWNNHIALSCNPDLIFDYTMAGGDAALMKSQEKAEDDVTASIVDLTDTWLNRKIDHLVYFGITCGLSAPYVGSQLEYLLSNQDVCLVCLSHC